MTDTPIARIKRFLFGEYAVFVSPDALSWMRTKTFRNRQFRSVMDALCRQHETSKQPWFCQVVDMRTKKTLLMLNRHIDTFPKSNIAHEEWKCND